jgi:hypothetical protein
MLKREVMSLHEQLESLSIVQSDMANYLQQMSSNYRNLVSEVMSFRNAIVHQDRVMNNLIEYSVKRNQGRKIGSVIVK